MAFAQNRTEQKIEVLCTMLGQVMSVYDFYFGLHSWTMSLNDDF